MVQATDEDSTWGQMPEMDTAAHEMEQLKEPEYRAESSELQSEPKQQDVIAQVVLAKFESIKKLCNVQFGKIILAGFVLERDRGQYGVVSIGTGNVVIGGRNLSADGDRVNDSHAEIVARRGLVRFLHNQLLLHNVGSEDSIYEKRADKICLKGSYRLHLYISTAPCGDGAIFSHGDARGAQNLEAVESDNHKPSLERISAGKLRSKIENGEGTIPTLNMPGLEYQMLDGIQGGARLCTMSCSDKICKWNILGVQGTLLSRIIEPIYINSVVLGQLFHGGHLSRALCCRMNPLGRQLKKENNRFTLNHPRLAVAGNQTDRSQVKSLPLSMNWCMNDPEPEFVDGTTGEVLCVSERSAGITKESRICRKVLYKEFMECIKNIDYHGFESLKDLTYSDAKQNISEYTHMKERLYKEFYENNYNIWRRKPVELSQFIVTS